jgi:methionyl-tRNA formyltransferase
VKTSKDPAAFAVGPPRGLRVLFLGMRGAFSRAPLARLLDAGVDVRAVVLPGDAASDAGADPSPVRRLLPRPVARATLPLLTPYHEPSIVSLAWERAIPVLEVARAGDPATLAALAGYAPDVACVACWPSRLPPALLTLPSLGCLNLHPSLLPAHRGPAPLFWTLRHGDDRAGVSVHLMDERLDAGDVLAQEALSVPDGISGAELEERCAEVGGRLLVATLAALAAGTAERTPQPPGAGSYEPWPTSDDFVVTPDRPARQVFNFLRGGGYWGGPLVIGVAGHRFTVRSALDFSADGALGVPYRKGGAELWLQCAPGIMHALVE